MPLCIAKSYARNDQSTTTGFAEYVRPLVFHSRFLPYDAPQFFQIIPQSMSIAKTIEILAEGDTIESATEEAVRAASKTVKAIKNVYVDDYRGIVEDGEITAYRVHAKVTFVVENK